LLDGGVDVAHRGVEEGLGNVDIRSVGRRPGVLDDEPIQGEIRRLDTDVVVVAWLGGHGRSLLDRTRHGWLAVDHRVLAEEVHLARCADGRHLAYSPPTRVTLWIRFMVYK